MAFCLPKAEAAKFLDALKSGKIVPEDLMNMTSQERRKFFGGIIGDPNAEAVNAMFEEKMLLRDQKRGMVSWAKKIGGITPQVRKDIVTKIEKLDHILDPDEEHEFLADLAARKLGMHVTEDEARKIAQGAKKVSELAKEWNPDADRLGVTGKGNRPENGGWSSEDARLEYGAAYTEYQKYVSDLKGEARKPPLKAYFTSPGLAIKTVAGVTKGILASLDNSFFGRQGLKMLFTNPDIWSKAFVKSWGDMGRELRGHDAMLPIKADIYSRANAMNGKYRAMKLDIDLDTEEAFPSHLPERIPGLGRLYKASESAFNGAALRMRADYADKMIKLAEECGVDTLNTEAMQGLGRLVNSMTGRGAMTLAQKGMFSAENINATFFSIKFLKANFDTLTLHLFDKIEDPAMRVFVRKQAAYNMLKIAGGIGAVLFTSDKLWPGSVDWDPRSANFGKIKIGDTRFDVTGGMGSMVTLTSRLFPWTMHNGKFSNWSKSSTSGKFSDLRSGKYGQQNAVDVFNSFWEGKLSPLAGTLRDSLKGETFGGQPATAQNLALNAIMPLPAQTAQDVLNDPKAAPLLAVMIADGLGFGANTYPAKRKKTPQ